MGHTILPADWDRLLQFRLANPCCEFYTPSGHLSRRTINAIIVRRDSPGQSAECPGQRWSSSKKYSLSAGSRCNPATNPVEGFAPERPLSHCRRLFRLRAGNGQYWLRALGRSIRPLAARGPCRPDASRAPMLQHPLASNLPVTQVSRRPGASQEGQPFPPCSSHRYPLAFGGRSVGRNGRVSAAAAAAKSPSPQLWLFALSPSAWGRTCPRPQEEGCFSSQRRSRRNEKRFLLFFLASSEAGFWVFPCRLPQKAKLQGRGEGQRTPGMAHREIAYPGAVPLAKRDSTKRNPRPSAFTRVPFPIKFTVEAQGYRVGR